MNKSPIKVLCLFLGLSALGVGLFLRFWHITANQFLFYDEGMYLGYNRNFLHLVASNFPKDLHELCIILGVMFKTALTTAKALWFFILNLRVFIVGADAYYFARIVSALAGVATILLTYLFAKRYFQSKTTAFLSAVFLSLLPSHVFYSRLGMQESFSTLLFLAGLYVYIFYKGRNWGPILAATLFACVFLTNYRMIISPIFLIAIEVFESFKNREKFNWKRPLVGAIVFAGIIFVVGSLYGGVNRNVTFGWMLHQAKEAEGQRSLINIFSYPYYVFVLEGFLFAIMFWSNFYFIFKKQWAKLLPFLLVLVQMGIFSLAAERGARYLCVLLPMMAIAAAATAEYFLNEFNKKFIVVGFIILTCLGMTIESIKIVNSHTDYDKAVHLILEHDPEAQIISTQATVEALYVNDEKRVMECPKSLVELLELYKEGYHYLVVDPQVFISYTKSEKRFDLPLIDFLELIQTQVKPLVVYDHLSSVLLKRFVLDHNQNLAQSISFLQTGYAQGYGQIRVYDMWHCLMRLKAQSLQAAH